VNFAIEVAKQIVASYQLPVAADHHATLVSLLRYNSRSSTVNTCCQAAVIRFHQQITVKHT
jgi:hypothetical protein